jgi:hypothetical protein
VFTDALPCLVGHEVDHLYGNLYTARIRDGRHRWAARSARPERAAAVARSAVVLINKSLIPQR